MTQILSDIEPDELAHDRREPPWAVLAGAVALAALVLLLYGRSVKWPALVWGLFLLSIAATTVGGVVGFLFGVPRARREATTEVVDAGAGVRPGPVVGVPTIGAREVRVDLAPRTATGQIPYEPSNSLEQVVDWLTKILIGVGLVQFREIGNALARMGDAVEKGFGGTAGASVVAQTLVVALASLGFLGGFLWTRLYYGGIQTLADVEMLELLRGVGRQAARADEVSKALATGELRGAATAQARTARVGDEAAARLSDAWPDAVLTTVASFRAAPATWDSDPVANLLPDASTEGGGRRLMGEVVATYEDALMVRLRVEATGRRPMEGPVTFLLHPTFEEREQVAMADGKSAHLKIIAAGWFTVGAIADGGNTVLTLDLRTLDGVPAWFSER